MSSQYFDHIYLLSAPQNEQTRLPLALAELMRVGLIRSPSDPVLTVHYGTHPRIYDYVLDHTSRLGPSLIPGCYNQNVVIAFNYYLILSEAKARGFKRILYVEDDVRFLNDCSSVKKVFSSIPADADLAMMEWVVSSLDYFRSGKHRVHMTEHKGKTWIPMHPYGNFVHAGAQVLSEKAIDTLIRLIESGWYEIEGKSWCNVFKIIDQWQDQGVLGQFGISSYFAFPLPCIQSQEYGGYGGNSIRCYNRSYENGIDINSYSTSKSIKAFIKKKNDAYARRSAGKS